MPKMWKWLCILILPCFANEFVQISTSPRIYVCEHFLTDAECDHFIQLARPSLRRSTVMDPNSAGNLLDARRSSSGTWLYPSCRSPHLERLLDRISTITQIPKENGEYIQVLHYGIGAEYQPHFDYFDRNTAGGIAQLQRGGQRVATFMVYLNTPEEGGETIFPRARLAVRPEKGKAVLFYDVGPNGKEDPMSFHGGAPVIKGEKWIMTRWLRERAFK